MYKELLFFHSFSVSQPNVIKSATNFYIQKNISVKFLKLKLFLLATHSTNHMKHIYNAGEVVSKEE